MSTEAQARAHAENWTRYIISGQVANLNTLFQPEKLHKLPPAEYRKMYDNLDAAIVSLSAAHEALIKIQLQRKAP